MMKPRCSECGDTKPLNEDGVCRNRGGCEHRQFQHEARVERLQAEMDHAEHCPIHGRNGIYSQAQRTEPWEGSMYEQFIQGIIMGGPIFGTAWYEIKDDNRLWGSSEIEDEDE